jgi:pimeloyl-ACP methyl ester carboxylesterase
MDMATGDHAAERFIVRVPDGRAVEVLTAGPDSGPAFVFHTGSPHGLVAFAPMIEAAMSLGLRSVYYSRPGYGNSDPQPGRRVADAAADVAAILDHLRVEHFVTAGWSGGGPHALAAAALLPGRCLAAASLAGVAPYPAEGLDWMAGMAQENLAEFGAALQGEAALSSFLNDAAAALSAVTGEQVAEELGGLASAADRAVLTGEFADYLAEAFRAAVSTGIAGWRDDDLAFTTDWGFSLGDITVPLAIWQGDADAMVHFGHGQWLTRQLPRASAHLMPGEGHLTLIAHRITDVLAELVSLAGR